MHPEPERWKAATARQFDGIADRFRGFGLPDEERLAAVLAALDCAPGGLILDAGSGTGNWSVALARRGYRVAGFDISPQMVANAEAVAREHRLGEERVSFRRGDAERIDFPVQDFERLRIFGRRSDHPLHSHAARCAIRAEARPPPPADGRTPQRVRVSDRRQNRRCAWQPP